MLNIKEAIANFSNVTKSLNKIASAGDGVELADKVEMQREKLVHLANLMTEKPGGKVLALLQDKETVETLIFTIYHNAQRMALHGKYDMASLPCYELLPGLNQEMLLQKVNQLRENNKQQHFKKLPSVISLTDGYMMLEVIGYLFQLGKTKPKTVHWRWFVNEILKRNYSILAHGFIFVSGEQYQQFKSMVDSIFELFCLVEGIDQLNTAAGIEYLGTYTKKFLIIDREYEQNNKIIAKERNIQVIELKDSNVSYLSPSDKVFLKETIKLNILHS